MSEKPFPCPHKGCSMTFFNEDHLSVHRKKHDMVLNLEIPKNNNNLMDQTQTPTPTRFIRNCEEVGLFQDLQNVNPFDDTFKKALEKSGHLPPSQPATNSDDTLHTPNILPHISVTTTKEAPLNPELTVELSDDELIFSRVVSKMSRKSRSKREGDDEFYKAQSRREVNRASQYRSRLRKKFISLEHERKMIELSQQNDRLMVENEQLKDELRIARRSLEEHKKWCGITPTTLESSMLIPTTLESSMLTPTTLKSGVLIPTACTLRSTNSIGAAFKNTAPEGALMPTLKNITIPTNSIKSTVITPYSSSATLKSPAIHSAAPKTTGIPAYLNSATFMSTAAPFNSNNTPALNSTTIPPNSNHIIMAASRVEGTPVSAFVIQALPVLPLQMAPMPKLLSVGRSIVPKPPSGFDVLKKGRLSEKINFCGIESRNGNRRCLAKKPGHARNVNLLKRKS